MKKGDFLIFGIIFALFIVLFAVFLPRGGGKEVVVRQNNAEVYRLPLSDSKAPLRAVTESADYLRDRFSPLQVILSDSCGAPRP